MNDRLGTLESGITSGGFGQAGAGRSTPEIAVPKGGGAVRGIGEKFQVSAATGTGSITVPVATPRSRQGTGPSLALKYSSGAGNGPFGLGWSLSLPQISRLTDRGLPTYADGEEADTFLLSETEDLVPDLIGNGADAERRRDTREVAGAIYHVHRYRPRTEAAHARIERWVDTATGLAHWRTISADNVTSHYGLTPESRIAAPDDPSHVFAWLICDSADDRGNVVFYRYVAEDRAGVDPSRAGEAHRTAAEVAVNRYPKRISYGNRTPYRTDEVLAERDDWMFEVVFDYGEGHLSPPEKDPEGRTFVTAHRTPQASWPQRADPFSSHRATFEIRTTRLCRAILAFNRFPDELGREATLVAATALHHAEDPVVTRLIGVQDCAYRHQTGDRYLSHAQPPVNFEYSDATVAQTAVPVDADSLSDAPAGLAHPRVHHVDLEGEGLAGLMTTGGGALRYKANLGGGRFAPQVALTDVPVAAGAGADFRTMDLAGDGRADLVVLDGPAPGFHGRFPDRSWAPHRRFASLPTAGLTGRDRRFVDLTGDGRADLLVTEDSVFTWFRGEGERGFVAGHRIAVAPDDQIGPRALFTDPDESLYLADMTGDGLSDLVRIRRRSVVYWPNRGYGRFGAKVTMEDAPVLDRPEAFDQRRIRLADVDGSGTVDILYLRPDVVDLFVNRAGNSWAPARRITGLPSLDLIADVTVTDFLGTGTACLVWSSPLPGQTGRHLRYLDLVGATKPHMLVTVRNNRGAETRLSYAPSTRFYLADKAAGRPWLTTLPFPVQVVERVEVRDTPSGNRFVSRYSYHHGCFDGTEREFRGFAMVEQTDTEVFADLAASGDDPATNEDAATYAPPVLTRTWFHTGAGPGHEGLSRRLSGLGRDAAQPGYFMEPGLSEAEATAMLLADTPLPAGLSVAEEREACRAFRGQMLRQEVYALDGSDVETIPYTVTHQNRALRVVQRRGPNRHAVFLSHESERIVLQYERHATDPRTSHALVLEADAYGNPLRTVTARYGRRAADPALAPEDAAVQSRHHVTASEFRYTAPIDGQDTRRLPRGAEATRWHLTGLAPDPGPQRLGLAAVAAALADAERIAYHQVPGGGAVLRLLDRQRTRYRPDDLGVAAGDPAALLPLGQSGALSLTGETYHLAFTAGHLAALFDTDPESGLLEAAGGYVTFEDAPGWWIPSGRQFYSPDPGATAPEEAAAARAGFFLARRRQNPFGATERIDYDPHHLFPVATTDALGNRVSQRIDYRVLGPDLVTDANGNRSAVAYDVPGRVAGTAVMGPGGTGLGDTLSGFEPDPTPAQRAAFFADPTGPVAATLLAGATVRALADPDSFARDGTPVWRAAISRETHSSDLAPGAVPELHVAIDYVDGLGRGLHAASWSEPGPLTAGGPDVATRWTVSGRAVRDNKGQVVRNFEPVFDDSHAFIAGADEGAGSLMFRDPLGRVVATLAADHSWQKVVFDAWGRQTWDANDTATVSDPASDPDVGAHFARWPQADYLPGWHDARIGGAMGPALQQAAQKTAAHAATPDRDHLDGLGHAFLAVADAGPEGRIESRSGHDIDGLPLWIRDGRGNVVVRFTRQTGTAGLVVPGHDMLGRTLFHHSADAGARWELPDVDDRPFVQIDARGHRVRTRHDVLRRPTHVFVATDGAAERLVSLTLYGEGHAEAEARNLRGRVYAIHDGAGQAVTLRYDFKGNALGSDRRLTRAYRGTPDWSVLDGLDDPAAIAAAAEPLLEARVYASRTRFDALDRAVEVTAPDGSVLASVFNRADLLESLSVRVRGAVAATPYVLSTSYNARGQRTAIGVAASDGTRLTTTTVFDPDTFRSVRTVTLRERDGAVLRDTANTYDPVGNVTATQDAAQQTLYFDNAAVSPDADYTYDALYRLIRAEGREHASLNATQFGADRGPPLPGLPHPNDAAMLQRYVQRYEYDAADNILGLRHTGGGVLRWHRRYSYAADSNRLLATSVPGDAPGRFSDGYAHDVHGNMVTMPHLPLMVWNHRDALLATSRQATGPGTVPETTHYTYAADAERMRKVTDRAATGGAEPSRRRERIVLDGIEIYREFAGDGVTVTLERETLHVSDGESRIAQIDTRTVGTDAAPAQSRRYRFATTLGSITLETDDLGHPVIYEEYSPYGTNSLRFTRSIAEASLKRHGFTGKERDAETGLSYHGARYYAPWLGRWTAADPAGLADGLNLYRYVRNSPVVYFDDDGMAPSSGDVPGLPGRRPPKWLEKLTDIATKVVMDNQGNIGESEGGRRKKGHEKIEVIKTEGYADHPNRPDPKPKPPPTFRPPPVDLPAMAPSPEPAQPSTHPDGTDNRARKGEVAHPPELSIDKHTDPPAAPGSRGSRGIGIDMIPDKIDKRFISRLGKAAGKGLGRLAPGVGVGFSANDFNDGKYIQGTLGLFGEVPGIGDVVDMGVTAYEITSVIEEEFNISDMLVPHTDAVDALPEAYRKKVRHRGAPGISAPQTPAPPAPVVVTPPPTAPGFVGPPRLVDLPIS